MSIKIQVEMKHTTLMGMLHTLSKLSSQPFEYVIENNEDHVGILEYGSGIHSDAPDSTKQVIRPRRAKKLIVPILPKYSGKVSATTLSAARENAKKHPDIMTKLNQKYGSVIGFVFKDSVKGQKPVKMVRNSSRKVLQWFIEKFVIYLEHSDGSRRHLAMAFNKVGDMWFEEIKRKTPILTQTLRTGWMNIKRSS